LRIWQGKGVGSTLLAHELAQCDEQHLPACLESSNERNIPLYERFGCTVLTELGAGGSPGLWPMLRAAR
jgi:GNAT superfamily N-acetyltransferase